MDHKAEFALYHEFVLTSKNYIRTVIDINPDWFFEISPEFFDLDDFNPGQIKSKLERIKRRWEEEQEMMVAVEEAKKRKKQIQDAKKFEDSD
jgi:pre-mRNA-splicing factor ATP-dependent RNA helicase DHX15/PRP43